MHVMFFLGMPQGYPGISGSLLPSKTKALRKHMNNGWTIRPFLEQIPSDCLCWFGAPSRDIPWNDPVRNPLSFRVLFATWLEHRLTYHWLRQTLSTTQKQPRQNVCVCFSNLSRLAQPRVPAVWIRSQNTSKNENLSASVLRRNANDFQIDFICYPVPSWLNERTAVSASATTN